MPSVLHQQRIQRTAAHLAPQTTRRHRRKRQRSGRTRGPVPALTDLPQLLRLATRYSTLTLHQAAHACWGG
ncbi:hypothetical protein [Streptomyces goshikiensis]